MMHMRTTLNLDDELVRKAREYTGIGTKTGLIHEALRRLVVHEAGAHLSRLGGTMPNFQAGRGNYPVRKTRRK
jgi:Arc/MetJ family transcription regulator